MIRQVSERFIPVAVNLYKIRQSQDAGGKLFRSAQRQKDQYQGIWIISPEEKVLAGYDRSNDNPRARVREVLETLDAALKSSGSAKPRALTAPGPLPDPGRGLLPGGGVSLAVYTRFMHNDKPDGPPVIDSLTLTKEEWTAFLPPKVEEGKEWSLPVPLAERFVRTLSPISDQSAMPRPEESTGTELRAVVEAGGGKTVSIRWTGKLAAKHLLEGDSRRVTFGAAAVEGTAVYDRQLKTLRSLLVVMRGTYRSCPPYDQPRETGAVVEWHS